MLIIYQPRATDKEKKTLLRISRWKNNPSLYWIIFSLEYPQVSFVAHLAGVFAGLTVGLVILRNYEQRLVQCRSWWAAISLLLVGKNSLKQCFSTGVPWNIFRCAEILKIA